MTTNILHQVNNNVNIATILFEYRITTKQLRLKREVVCVIT